MPMARLFGLRIVSIQRGEIGATAIPGPAHENPFGVVQGGFAGTVLDIVLGLVSITVLPEEAASVGTTDLSVTYVRPIRHDDGTMHVHGRAVHSGKRIVVGEASLKNADGTLYAVARSTSLVLYAS